MIKESMKGQVYDETSPTLMTKNWIKDKHISLPQVFNECNIILMCTCIPALLFILFTPKLLFLPSCCYL